jgi:hypothetical protein
MNVDNFYNKIALTWLKTSFTYASEIIKFWKQLDWESLNTDSGIQ